MESRARTKKAVEPAGEFPAIDGEPALRRACRYARDGVLVGRARARCAAND